MLLFGRIRFRRKILHPILEVKPISDFSFLKLHAIFMCYDGDCENPQQCIYTIRQRDFRQSEAKLFLLQTNFLLL